LERYGGVWYLRLSRNRLEARMIRHTPLKHRAAPIRRNSPLKRAIRAKKSSFPESLERVDWKGVMALRRKPRKKQPGDNPEYLDWLRTWPCFVCLKRWHGSLQADCRAWYQELFAPICGPTQAAHVGPHGMGQRCPDSEAMPLGQKHHLHLTAGGGPESHHTLGTKFWDFHNLNRDEVFELLHRLYREETGCEV
jgi:hypothetical protein